MGNNEHTIVYLIGMGPGNSDCLTREAVQALSQATVCIGASRMLAIWKSLCEEDGRDAEQTFYNAYKAEEIAELIQNHGGETIAVVFSGDIGFYSGAKKLSMMLRKAVGKVCNMVDDTTGTTEQIQADKTIYELCYIPGLSSVQYLFDKIGWAWEDAELISNHGVSANIPAKVLHHAKVGTLLGGENQVAEVCKRLTEVGLGEIAVVVGEWLSYPDEKITKKYAKNLCEETFDKLAVAIFINDHPQPRRLAPGIKDEMFIRGKVPMTKEEVRMVVIAKLGIQEDTGLVKYDQNSGQFVISNPAPVIYDVGAGTGSVSIELALLTERGTVYAIEKKPEAVKLMYANRRRFHAGNMEIIEGEASEVIPSLPAPTHVFIGGNDGNLFKIMDQIYAKNPNARIVLTAVTLETQAEMLTLADIAKRHNVDFNMVQMAVTRSREAGPYHMMQAQNPVWIVTMG